MIVLGHCHLHAIREHSRVRGDEMRAARAAIEAVPEKVDLVEIVPAGNAERDEPFISLALEDPARRSIDRVFEDAGVERNTLRAMQEHYTSTGNS